MIVESIRVECATQPARSVGRASTAGTVAAGLWFPPTRFMDEINQVIVATHCMSSSFHVRTSVAREMLSYLYRTYCANASRETYVMLRRTPPRILRVTPDLVSTQCGAREASAWRLRCHSLLAELIGSPSQVLLRYREVRHGR